MEGFGGGGVGGPAEGHVDAARIWVDTLSLKIEIMIFYSSHQRCHLGMRARTRTHTQEHIHTKYLVSVRSDFVLCQLEKKTQFWLCVDFVCGDSSDNTGCFISGLPSCTATESMLGRQMECVWKRRAKMVCTYWQAFCSLEVGAQMGFLNEMENNEIGTK